ncbi:MAG: division/cell wall cluster transcriptional repressor MraZ [Candidatus Binataceae bacterium]
MFSGRFDHTIDDKGRVSLPAAFRDLLLHEGPDRIYITNQIFGGEHCLDFFMPSDWERALNRLRERPRDAELLKLEMFYVGGAHEIQIDRQGRVLIPPRLRQFAQLDKDVTFQGQLDRYQLWDRSKLAGMLGGLMGELKVPGVMEKIGL